jgi:hypothetical protein
MKIIRKYILVSFSKILPLLFAVFLVPLANIFFESDKFVYFTTSFLVFTLISSFDFGLGSFLLSKLEKIKEVQIKLFYSVLLVLFIFLGLWLIFTFNVVNYPAFHKSFGLLIFVSGFSQVIFNLVISIYNINRELYFSSLFNVTNIFLKIITSIISIVIFKNVDLVFLSFGIINLIFCFYFFYYENTLLSSNFKDFYIFIRELIPFGLMFIISYLNSNYVKIFIQSYSSVMFSTYSILNSISVIYLLVQSTFSLFVLKALQKERESAIRVLFFFLVLSILIYSFSFLILSYLNSYGWFNIFKPLQLPLINKLFSIVFSTSAFYSLQIIFFQISIFKENIRLYLIYALFFLILAVPIFYFILSNISLRGALIFEFFAIAFSTILLNYLVLKSSIFKIKSLIIWIYFITTFCFFVNCILFIFGTFFLQLLFFMVTFCFYLIFGLYNWNKLQTLKLIYEF